MSPYLVVAFDQAAILKPLLAMMLLTALVWLYMLARRVGWMLGHGIAPQRVATPEARVALLPEAVERPSNNLKNLFELPVLFYALCIVLLVQERVDLDYVELAWAFVALRTLHSLVHCTVNIVKLRFAFYLLSSLVLWAMLARFVLAVF